MANMTSTLDDQQERHYIGNLLCDEDVFGQTNNRTVGMFFIGLLLITRFIENVNFNYLKSSEISFRFLLVL